MRITGSHFSLKGTFLIPSSVKASWKKSAPKGHSPEADNSSAEAALGPGTWVLVWQPERPGVCLHLASAHPTLRDWFLPKQPFPPSPSARAQALQATSDSPISFTLVPNPCDWPVTILFPSQSPWPPDPTAHRRGDAESCPGPFTDGAPGIQPPPPRSTSGQLCPPAASRVVLTVSPQQRADISAASCPPAPLRCALAPYPTAPRRGAVSPRHGEPPGPLVTAR